MKKLIKFFAIFSIIALVIVVAGSTLLGMFIDPNDYKKQIEQAALDKADIELKINGDISWSLYPSIGLNINDIQAAYANKPALASLSNANVSVMLTPLLSGDIQVKDILVEGLELNLIEDDNGNNWQAVTDKNSTEEAPAKETSASTPSTTTDTTTTFDVNNITVASITISNANITHTAKATNTVSKISNFNLSTGEISLGKSFDANLAFDALITEKEKSLLSSKTDLTATFTIDTTNQHFKIDSLKSNLSITTDQTIDLQLNTNIDAKLKDNTVSLSNLELRSNDLTAKGEVLLNGENFDQIKGILSIESFNLHSLLKELKLPSIDTKDKNALSSIALTTQLGGSATELSLNQFLLTIDDTKISGNANYQLANGFLDFNLKGDSINLSRYLPEKTKDAAAPTTKPTNSSSNSTPSNNSPLYSKDIIIPIEPLRALKLNGSLTFEKVTYENTALSNIDVKVNANQGLVKIPALNMNTYQGKISNNITLDARKETLSLSILNTIKSLSVGPVLIDFAQTDALTGVLNSDTKLTANGQSIHSIINSLNGNIQLNLANGVIKGIDAAHEMCGTINQIASLGGTASETQEVDTSTSFALIKGLLTFKNGVISNNNFNASLDAINVSGKGTVSLPKQTLNYKLGLKIDDNLFNKSCSVNNKIQDIEWPVDCRGSFNDDPLTLCKPDLSIIKDLAKKALEDELKKQIEKKIGTSLKAKEQEIKQELQNKIEEKAKDKLKDALKGLF